MFFVYKRCTHVVKHMVSVGPKSHDCKAKHRYLQVSWLFQIILVFAVFLLNMHATHLVNSCAFSHSITSVFKVHRQKNNFFFLAVLRQSNKISSQRTNRHFPGYGFRKGVFPPDSVEVRWEGEKFRCWLYWM